MRAHAAHVSPMPMSLNFAQAAAVPIASLTAFQASSMQKKGAIVPGQKALYLLSQVKEVAHG